MRPISIHMGATLEFGVCVRIDSYVFGIIHRIYLYIYNVRTCVPIFHISGTAGRIALKVIRNHTTVLLVRSFIADKGVSRVIE